MKKTADLRLAWDQLVLAMKDYMSIWGLKRMQVEQHAAHFEAAFRLLAATPFQITDERQLLEVLRG